LIAAELRQGVTLFHADPRRVPYGGAEDSSRDLGIQHNRSWYLLAGCVVGVAGRSFTWLAHQNKAALTGFDTIYNGSGLHRSS
jgi:hypothetical protein